MNAEQREAMVLATVKRLPWQQRTAWSIARFIHEPVERVTEALEALQRLGLVKRGGETWRAAE